MVPAVAGLLDRLTSLLSATRVESSLPADAAKLTAADDSAAVDSASDPRDARCSDREPSRPEPGIQTAGETTACKCSSQSHPAGSDSTGRCCSTGTQHDEQPTPSVSGRLLYGSESGSTKRLAEAFASQARRAGVQLAVSDVADYELEHLCKEAIFVCFISTQQDGQPPTKAR